MSPDALTLPERLNKIHHLITARTLAEMLALAPCTLYKLAREGNIPAVHLGYGVRFDPAAVARWLAGKQMT